MGFSSIPWNPQFLHRLELYRFGIQTLVLRKIESLRARISNLNGHTAKSKIYRITGKNRFPKVFTRILVKLGMVGEKDTAVVDFSDFGNGFQVLMFAKQTRKGRTIPLHFEVLHYPIKKGSQNLFIIRAIKNLEQLLGCKTTLVCDREFACPVIVQFLAKNQYNFLLGIKKSQSVIDVKTKKRFAARDSVAADISVMVYAITLRLIIAEGQKLTEEPWYLLTSITSSSHQRLIETYYHRFAIEEFFRDAKRLLGLEYINFYKETSLAITLWFALLGFWLLWSLEQTEFHLIERMRTKMQLSVVRYFLEGLITETIIKAEGEFMLKGG